MRRLLHTGLLLLGVFQLQAQDVHFSQYLLSLVAGRLVGAVSLLV